MRVAGCPRCCPACTTRSESRRVAALVHVARSSFRLTPVHAHGRGRCRGLAPRMARSASTRRWALTRSWSCATARVRWPRRPPPGASGAIIATTWWRRRTCVQRAGRLGKGRAQWRVARVLTCRARTAGRGRVIVHARPVDAGSQSGPAVHRHATGPVVPCECAGGGADGRPRPAPASVWGAGEEMAMADEGHCV